MIEALKKEKYGIEDEQKKHIQMILDEQEDLRNKLEARYK